MAGQCIYHKLEKKSVRPSVSQSVSQLASQSIRPSVSQPASQSVSPSVSQSVSASVNQSVGQSVRSPVFQSSAPQHTHTTVSVVGGVCRPCVIIEYDEDADDLYNSERTTTTRAQILVQRIY